MTEQRDNIADTLRTLDAALRRQVQETRQWLAETPAENTEVRDRLESLERELQTLLRRVGQARPNDNEPAHCARSMDSCRWFMNNTGQGERHDTV